MLVLMLAGCPTEPSVDAGTDAGTADTGASDGGTEDDAGASDGGTEDDAGTSDGGTEDDAGTSDADVASGPSILGLWRAIPAPGFRLDITFAGAETAGTIAVDQATPSGGPGCVNHTVSEGTFTRTGATDGAIELIHTSGINWIDSCTDPADDVAEMPLTPEQLAGGRIDGTYTLDEASFVLTFEISGAGTFTTNFLRP